MSEPLYPYYERELLFIRQFAQEFARKYPATAGGLLLEQGVSADPHAERLMEACALLTARVQHKLDDEFPELTDALLGVLYPHYLAPIPSMAVAQFVVDPTRSAMPCDGFPIARHSYFAHTTDQRTPLPLPHLLPGDAVANPGGRRLPDDAAVPARLPAAAARRRRPRAAARLRGDFLVGSLAGPPALPPDGRRPRDGRAVRTAVQRRDPGRVPPAGRPRPRPADAAAGGGAVPRPASSRVSRGCCRTRTSRSSATGC